MTGPITKPALATMGKVATGAVVAGGLGVELFGGIDSMFSTGGGIAPPPDDPYPASLGSPDASARDAARWLQGQQARTSGNTAAVESGIAAALGGVAMMTGDESRVLRAAGAIVGVTGLAVGATGVARSLVGAHEMRAAASDAQAAEHSRVVQ